MPIISIIVVAYNAAKYLPRCLDSICAQSFTDFEVIFVDDGSEDNTYSIAREYADRDHRFMIIKQSNQGVAGARRTGMDNVHGEYVIHIDADDWMEHDMLEKLYLRAKTSGADMVICDFYVHRPGNVTEKWSQQFNPLDSLSVLGQMMYENLGTLWNKLNRTACVKKFKIVFDPDMTVCEDKIFVLKLLAHNIKVEHLKAALYHYDTSSNPYSFSNNGISIEQQAKVLEEISSYTDISPITDYYNNAFLHLAYDSLLHPSLCKDFEATFTPHKAALRKAKGLPLHVKIMVLAQLAGFSAPMKLFKAAKTHLKKSPL